MLLFNIHKKIVHPIIAKHAGLCRDVVTNPMELGDVLVTVKPWKPLEYVEQEVFAFKYMSWCRQIKHSYDSMSALARK